jgi:hypothetical protein
MTFLIMLAILVCVTVVPVMVGARLVGAERTGFGASLLAVIVLAAIGAAVGAFVDNKLAQGVVSAVLGAFLLAGILGTTFWRGLAVSLIAAVVQIVALVLFAGALIGGAAMTQ